eukprot:CAMPEP_0114982064 /NCGR_PEP_ID=MMETSP0216-20121206/5890_1 /TAXON_ID=223996 /ORGANISM="Protocruzia adherens, Strain Boccale" /LENGTH=318 /DNA_ID=CAMNT_0002343801 /DNA_START=30 /DNA_END=986 /DNA_ORIENTATION=+
MDIKLLPKKSSDAHKDKDETHHSVRGILWMVAANVLFFLNFFMTKVLSAENSVGPLQSLTFRGYLQVFGNLLFAWYRGYPLTVAPKYHRLMMWRALSGTIGVIAVYYAFSLFSQSTVLTVLWTNPFIVAIAAACFLGETLAVIEIISVIVGFLGVLFVTKPTILFGDEQNEQEKGSDWHLLIPFIGALSAGVSYTLIRKTKSNVHFVIPVVYFGVGIMIAAPIGAMLDSANNPPMTWFGFFSATFSGSLACIGQVCMSRGLQLEKAAVATAIGFLQIFLSFLSDYLYFGIPKDWIQMGGSFLILTALIGLTYRKVQTK